MKAKTYLGALLISLTAACHAPAAKKGQQDSTVSLQDTVPKETQEPAIDSARLIIAGKQAGKIHLGQDMQEVIKILGRADDGDAAMGSALGIWYSKENAGKKNPTIIFSSYLDSNMVVKAVKQVSVAAPEFQTAKGLHTGVKLAALLAAYPALKKTETYVNSKNKRDTLKVYDSSADGIAFDIQNDTCTSVTVHVRNRPANAVYLPVHADWRKL